MQIEISDKLTRVLAKYMLDNRITRYQDAVDEIIMGVADGKKTGKTKANKSKQN